MREQELPKANKKAEKLPGFLGLIWSIYTTDTGIPYYYNKLTKVIFFFFFFFFFFVMATPNQEFSWERPTGELSTTKSVIATNTVCRGGILADEQGMGKTIMMLSLLLTNRPKRTSFFFFFSSLFFSFFSYLIDKSSRC